jgi:hypothetical protein
MRRAPARLVLLLALVAYVGHVLWYDFFSDDGFIALRYAKNLIEGHGLVFNPGERVEGFTSLLWVLMLAGAGALGIDLLVCARIAGVAFGALAIIAAYQLARELDGRRSSWSLLAPALIAVNGSFACWAAAGLETTLFTCIVVAAVLATVSGRPRLAAAMAGLASLARPEGMLVVGVLGAYQAFRSRGAGRAVFLRWVLIAGSFVAGGVVFRAVYFGDLLPNTFYAKTGGTWWQWKRGLDYLADYAADHEGLPLILLVVLAGLASGEAPVRVVSLCALALGAGVVWVGGDGLPMYRLWVPVVPLFCVLGGFVVSRLWQALAPQAVQPRWVARGLLVVAIGALIAVDSSRPGRGAHYWDYEYQRQVEIPRWTRVGLWFRAHARPGESLAAVPIGAVSYYSGLTVYDMLGLTDRHVARVKPPDMGRGVAGHEKHDGQYILGRRPTYLLLGNIDVTSAPRDAARRPFIPYENRLIWAREADMYTTDVIFRRYRPRSVEIGPNEYLNFYEVRPEHRAPEH